MRVAVPDPSMHHAAQALLWLLPVLASAPALANEEPDAICEYRTLEVDAQTGDIHFIVPVKTGPEDCSGTGAALADLDPAWRQKLPPRVRWTQLPDAVNFCQTAQTSLGQRVQVLPEQGCVFLQAQVACTIVTAQAVSHAQLANAVRGCVP